MPSNKKDRKGPKESATLYKIGTKKTGLYGNKWIVAENKNSIKRWKLLKVVQKPLKKSNSKTQKKITPKKPVKKPAIKPPEQTIKYNKKTKKLERYHRGKWIDITRKNMYDFVLTEEQFKKYTYPETMKITNISKLLKHDEKIKKIGSIEITGKNIALGELYYTQYVTKPGIYDIYYYNGSLIAIQSGKTLDSQKFKLQKDSIVGCDIGMFSISDPARTEKYREKSKGRIKYTTDPYKKLNTVRFHTDMSPASL